LPRVLGFYWLGDADSGEGGNSLLWSSTNQCLDFFHESCDKYKLADDPISVISLSSVYLTVLNVLLLLRCSLFRSPAHSIYPGIIKRNGEEKKIIIYFTDGKMRRGSAFDDSLSTLLNNTANPRKQLD
jgi:hypothetical protein